MNTLVPPPPPKPGPPSRPKPPARAEVTFNFPPARPPAERTAFLAEACGDDAALHGEVRALLAAHDILVTINDGEATARELAEKEMQAESIERLSAGLAQHPHGRDSVSRSRIGDPTAPSRAS